MRSPFHPWQALRSMPDVTLVYGDPGPGVLGSVDYATRTITLSADLLQAEARTTLAHELIHLERGPAPPGSEEREEAVVERETARRLIPLAALVSAIGWTDDSYELARELGVDQAAVETRLRHLEPHEQRLVAAARRARGGG